MIFDTADPAQKMAFITAVMTHELRYGCARLLRLPGSLIMLIEPWPGPIVRHR